MWCPQWCAFTLWWRRRRGICRGRFEWWAAHQNYGFYTQSAWLPRRLIYICDQICICVYLLHKNRYKTTCASAAIGATSHIMGFIIKNMSSAFVRHSETETSFGGIAKKVISAPTTTTTIPHYWESALAVYLYVYSWFSSNRPTVSHTRPYGCDSWALSVLIHSRQQVDRHPDNSMIGSSRGAVIIVIITVTKSVEMMLLALWFLGRRPQGSQNKRSSFFIDCVWVEFQMATALNMRFTYNLIFSTRRPPSAARRHYFY